VESKKLPPSDAHSVPVRNCPKNITHIVFTA
jgi:hypothetical protein